MPDRDRGHGPRRWRPPCKHGSGGVTTLWVDSQIRRQWLRQLQQRQRSAAGQQKHAALPQQSVAAAAAGSRRPLRLFSTPSTAPQTTPPLNTATATTSARRSPGTAADRRVVQWRFRTRSSTRRDAPTPKTRRAEPLATASLHTTYDTCHVLGAHLEHWSCTLKAAAHVYAPHPAPACAAEAIWPLGDRGSRLHAARRGIT